MIINLYKEKLNKREIENRNLLVELKRYKTKVETIKEQYIVEINALKEEIRVLNEKLKKMEKNHIVEINSLKATIQSLNITIRDLKAKITELMNRPVETKIEYRDRVVE